MIHIADKITWYLFLCCVRYFLSVLRPFLQKSANSKEIKYDVLLFFLTASYISNRY